MQPSQDPSEIGTDWLDQALASAFRGEPDHAADAAGRERDPSQLLVAEQLLAADAPNPGDAGPSLPPDSRYELLDEAGRGGLGVVYRSRDRDLGREVALKVLDRRLAGDASFVRRFVEEAQVCSRLQHPGVVPVHEVGLDLAERPFFVMKLIAGRTFAEVLRERAAVEDQRRHCLDVFERVCQTMAYAHGQGVIHRDLKPANIMIGAFGEVQVVDWGLAKVLHGARALEPSPPAGGGRLAANQSTAGSVVGTASYMPPEQARGENERVDACSDVFALGAILCETLIGMPPYPATDGEPLALARAADLAPVHRRLATCGAEPDLIDLATRCLQAEPPHRPGSATAVAQAVGAHFAALEARARTAQVQAATAKAKARATLQIAATALVAILIGAGSFVWLQQREHERQVAARARVEAALTDSVAAATAARAGDGANVGAWERATHTAEKAASLATALSVDADLHDRTQLLLAEVTRSRREAVKFVERREREATVREQLLEIRVPTGEILHEIDDMARLDAAYAGIFRDYLGGRDLLTMPTDEVVDALRGDLALEFAAALHHWKAVRFNRTASADGLRDAKAMSVVVEKLDPDPTRTRLRTMRFDSREAAVKFVAALDLQELPLAAIQLLSSSFCRHEEREAGAALAMRACELHPGDLTLTVHCASLLHLQGRYDEAVRYFRMARAMNSHLVAAHYGLGASLAGLQRWQEAEACYRRAVELRRSPTCLAGLGSALVQQGRREQGRAYCQEAIAIDPRSHLAYEVLARSWLAEWRWTECLAAARKAHELHPGSDVAADMVAYAEFWSGNRASGLERAQQLVARNPGDAVMTTHLAAMRCETGRPEEAASMVEKILAQGEDDNALQVLARACFKLGRRSEAERHSRRAVENSQDLSSHLNLAAILDSAERAQELAELAHKIITLDPKSGLGESYLGSSLNYQGDHEGAVLHLQRAVELDDNNANAHHKLAVILAELGQDEAACPHFLRAAQLAAWSPAVLYNAAALLARLGRFDEAMDCLDDLEALDARFAPLWMLRGNMYSHLGRPEDALTALKRAIELEPRNGRCHASLSAAQARAGDVASARASMREALVLDPTLMPEALSQGIDFKQQGLVPQAVVFLEAVRDAAVAGTPQALSIREQAEKALAELAQHR